MWATLTLSLVLSSQVPALPDRRVFLGEAREIAAPGIPGDVVVYGAQAVPLVVGKIAPGQAAVAAVGALGRGRVAAFGHTGYLDAGTWAVANTGPVMERTLISLTGKTEMKIGVLGASGLRDRLAKLGTARDLTTTDALDGLDVVLVQQSDLPTQTVDRIGRFVREGGALLATATGWGWEMVSGRPVSDLPINRVLREAGMSFGNAMLERTSKEGFDTLVQIDPLVHAGHALNEALKNPTPGAADTIVRAVTALPADDQTYLPSVRTFRAQIKEPGIPGPEHPIRRENGTLRLAVALDTLETRRADPKEITAHPAAKLFPGEVPSGAARLQLARSIDPKTPGWHSLGLYAAPGEIVRVTVPAEKADRGLTLQIGSHTDSLWHLEAWRRMPEVVRRFPVKTATTEIASAMGGLIYVDVPEGFPAGTIRVEFGNVVEAPVFLLGQHSAADWTRLRKAPGPWAEIGSDKVIVTVPSSVVRGLENPQAVAEFWDRVADACADLAGWPRERRRPERMVADEQISAGYMHSGYPIMTHLDVKDWVVDVPRLMKEGSWGHFHELGHNHQSGDWTFEGTGEVTVNLFSMYVYKTVLGQPFDQGHPAIRSRADRIQRLQKHIREGASFDRWQNDPFLALSMYIQLIEGFGWDPVIAVIAEYRQLPAAQRPKSEMDKRDQWMVRLSRRTGRNLGPFFAKWGVPTSEKARASLRELPEWMPEELK